MKYETTAADHTAINSKVGVATSTVGFQAMNDERYKRVRAKNGSGSAAEMTTILLMKLFH